MAKIKGIISIVRGFAPENSTEPDFDDNVGLIVGTENGETDKVVLCLDCTIDVLKEAASIGAKLIISHHPIIYSATKRIIDTDATGNRVLFAAKHDITVYCAHTNLDFCDGGINDYCAMLMGLENVKPMTVDGDVKIGRVGDIKQPTTLKEFAQAMKNIFLDKNIQVVGNGERVIKRVALINGGAGDIEYQVKAMSLQADCYVSGDFRHHALVFAYESGFSVINIQHYCMEHIYISHFAEILSVSASRLGLKVGFTVSECEKNPVNQEVL